MPAGGYINELKMNFTMRAIRSIYIRSILIIGVLLYCLSSCNKTIQNPQTFPVHPIPAFDTLHNLRHMIDSLPNSDLFLLALQRTGYDTLLLRQDSIYTLLVPTDSLLISMGYTKDVITYLNPSLLLTGVIIPQFLYGNYSDSLLDQSAYVPVRTKADPATGITYGYQLGKQAGPAGGLWIFGSQVSPQTSGLRASNGYLYSVNTYYVAPIVNAWQLLQSKPEFSYFVAACRINDSIYAALGSQYRGYPFNNPSDTEFLDFGTKLTYFVPTNQAFINAGFQTIDDIRAFAGTAQYDPSNATVSPLDTIIYGHCMPDTAVLYYDLLRNPGFNQRPLASAPYSSYNPAYDNTNFESVLYNIAYEVGNDPYAFPAQYGGGQKNPYIGEFFFQATGNTVTVTCSSGKNPPAATIVERDLICGGNVILHGVDHLFWPY